MRACCDLSSAMTECQVGHPAIPIHSVKCESLYMRERKLAKTSGISRISSDSGY